MGFWLIQSGKFNDIKNEYESFVSGGNDSLVKLDYMGAAEFEFGAIPHAFTRIMFNFKSYILYSCENIKDEFGNPLIIFCEKNYAKQIETELIEYLETNYELKRYAVLKPYVNGEERGRKKDFFWCIDREEIGNWICSFNKTKMNEAYNYLSKKYKNWWKKKSKKEQLSEYNESLDW